MEFSGAVCRDERTGTVISEGLLGTLDVKAQRGRFSIATDGAGTSLKLRIIQAVEPYLTVPGFGRLRIVPQINGTFIFTKID